MVKKVKVSAPGKIILSGEHSVVYNKPAILAAINLRLSVSLREHQSKEDEISSPEPNGLVKYGVQKLKSYCRLEKTLKILINSDIPIGCGLGSSAALSSALSGAFRRYADKPWNLTAINDLAYEIEEKQHGNPSGADNTVSTYGGVIYYKKKDMQKEISTLDLDDIKKDFPLVILNTGKPSESTKEMVDLVKKLLSKTPRRVKRVLKRMEKVTNKFLRFLSGEEVSLIKIIKENEILLEKLGVVSPYVMKLIREIERRGGAAKITGAGGVKKGSGMLLAYHPQPKIIENFAENNGLDCFYVKLGEEGVKDGTS